MPPRGDPDVTVTQSLIDRLIDNDPKSASDAYTTRSQSVRQMKAGLRRDLEWLLNTRRTPLAAGEEYPELTKSLYNFGLPDFSTLNVHSFRDRDRLLLSLEKTVAAFEPRLKDVRVTLRESSDPIARTVHFQIDGILDMDPAPEAVSFDTVLDLAGGGYHIKGDRGA